MKKKKEKKKHVIAQESLQFEGHHYKECGNYLDKGTSCFAPLFKVLRLLKTLEVRLGSVLGIDVQALVAASKEANTAAQVSYKAAKEEYKVQCQLRLIAKPVAPLSWNKENALLKVQKLRIEANERVMATAARIMAELNEYGYHLVQFGPSDLGVQLPISAMMNI
ncbi:hypothetical protein PMIN02_009699 [Paraphaeosphaeria minitans]